jgi:hypothetical protein
MEGRVNESSRTCCSCSVRDDSEDHLHGHGIRVSPWAFKVIAKYQRGFLWSGRKGANGGHCLLAWPKVTCSKELGGLGIHDVRSLSLASRARWPWLQRTDPDKPWAQFQIQVSTEVQNLLDMTLVTVIGDRANTLFLKANGFKGKESRRLRQPCVVWFLKE